MIYALVYTDLYLVCSGAEARTIVLRNIGTLDDDDLRGTYKYFDSGRDVVERVFTLIDEDSAVVVFTHAKCKYQVTSLCITSTGSKIVIHSYLQLAYFKGMYSDFDWLTDVQLVEVFYD